MADIPTGLSEKEIIAALTVIEADAEIGNVPPPQRQAILDRARKQLELKPGAPPGQNPTP